MTQVGALGQVLPDEAVGVLVGAAFPRMVRRRKIDFRVQDVFQFPVVMKLGAIVSRDGFSRACGSSSRCAASKASAPFGG